VVPTRRIRKITRIGVISTMFTTRAVSVAGTTSPNPVVDSVTVA
jgi:hypothetical protein